MKILIVARVSDVPTPYGLENIVRSCDRCAEPVWVSRVSPAFDGLICLRCVLPDVLQSATVTPEVRREADEFTLAEYTTDSKGSKSVEETKSGPPTPTDRPADGPANSGGGLRKPLRVDAAGQVVDADGTVCDVAAAIEALKWKSALPSSGAAHQYCVLFAGNRDPWDVVATAIAHHPDSFMAFHRGYRKPTRYLEVGGWRLWRTAAGNSNGHATHMLNRCRPSSDTLRPVELGPAEWVGPPWLPCGSAWPPGYVRDPHATNPAVSDSTGRFRYVKELDTRVDYPCRSCGRRFYWHAGRLCPRCGTPAGDLPG